VKYRRKILEGVEGYVPGEQPKFDNIVKLNTNENPYPPSPKVVEAIRSLTADQLRKYPDPVFTELRRTAANVYGYPDESWVIAGNGMDELLAMAIRAFTDPGDTILSCYPTYILYETLALLHGAKPLLVDLDDQFQLPESFYSTKARLCFIPRPNSPSGVCAPKADIERLCNTFDGIVAIDEAYADFADDTCMDLARKYDNCIVMRTFSKAYSLASMRIGVAVANPAIIAEFMKTKDSYNLNLASQVAAVAALDDQVHMLANAAKIKTTRARLIAELRRIGFVVPDSQANFILAQWNGTPSAKTIFEKLREQAIVVRYFSSRRLDNALRITVGTDEEIDKLLSAIRVGCA
jgi:histidinol-phosphate aminotransferase